MNKDNHLMFEAYNKVFLKEESTLEKIKRLNPEWSPEKSKADFANNYDAKDPADVKDHKAYMKDAEKFINMIASFTPSMKIGDWVKVQTRNMGEAIGKIEKESVMQGHDYGYMGYKGPSNIPSWRISLFLPDRAGLFQDREPNLYAKVGDRYYYRAGVTDAAIWDEKKFPKLKDQNVQMEDINSEDAEDLMAKIEAKRKGRKNIGSVRSEDAEGTEQHCSYAQKGCDCDECDECETNQTKSEDAETWGVEGKLKEALQEIESVGHGGDSINPMEVAKLVIGSAGDWGDSYQPLVQALAHVVKEYYEKGLQDS
jgi:hypothetical protein